MKEPFVVKTAIDFTELLARLIKNTKPYVEAGNFKPFDVVLTEHKIKRTNLQNAYYWANAEDIVKILDKMECFIMKMGVKCKWTKHDVDDVNKDQFGTNSTAKLSTKEFGDLMENTFAFWIDKTKGEWKPLETAESYFANNK